MNPRIGDGFWPDREWARPSKNIVGSLKLVISNIFQLFNPDLSGSMPNNSYQRLFQAEKAHVCLTSPSQKPSELRWDPQKYALQDDLPIFAMDCSHKKWIVPIVSCHWAVSESHHGSEVRCRCKPIQDVGIQFQAPEWNGYPWVLQTMLGMFQRFNPPKKGWDMGTPPQKKTYNYGELYPLKTHWNCTSNILKRQLERGKWC